MQTSRNVVLLTVDYRSISESPKSHKRSSIETLTQGHKGMSFERKIGFASGERRAHAEQHAFGSERANLERAIGALISERRKRGSLFPSHLFSDPAWDILLVLALAETRHQRLSISRLCDRLDVPGTTVLRWIGALTGEGLLVRRDDVNDKRRKYVELSPSTYAAMAAYCSTSHSTVALAA